MVLNGGSTPMFPSFCNSYLALLNCLERKKRVVKYIFLVGGHSPVLVSIMLATEQLFIPMWLP